MKKLNIRKNFLIFRITLSVLIIVSVALIFVFKSNIETMISGNASKEVKESSSKIYFIDVGLGDATFMQFSNGDTALIDCGAVNKGTLLSSFLKGLEVTTITHLIYTHQDADHIGGGAKIFADFEVRNLYRPKMVSKTEKIEYGNENNYNESSTDAYDNAIMGGYHEVGCSIHYNDADTYITGVGYDLDFLYPTADSYTDNNAYSAVIKLEMGGKSFLLTGDADIGIEADLVTAYGTMLDVDVLKVGHHGSSTSTSNAFLSYVKPEYSVISVAYRKGWEFPHKEVLENLEGVNSEVYRTDKNGTIAMGVEGGKLTIFPYSTGVQLDMPLIVTIGGVVLLVVWGLPLVFKKKKKETK